jgi:hypothetical protein
VAANRQRWRGWQGVMDPARFVFLDETGTATNMARHYGRCPAPERLVAAVPASECANHLRNCGYGST